MKLSTTLLKSVEDVIDYAKWRVRKGLRRSMPGQRFLANVAEGFRPHGKKTYYPVDQPYSLRYLLVMQAKSTDTGASTLINTYGISVDDLCKLCTGAQLAAQQTAPLGFCVDAPGLGGLDVAPISTDVQLLGGAQQKTIQGVGDAVINAGALTVVSLTTAGYVGNVPSVAGLYWSPGLAISTSEGSGLPVEIDPHRIVAGVDIIT
jgi:hypothetical protein